MPAPPEADSSMWICKEPPVSVIRGLEEEEEEGEEEEELDPAMKAAVRALRRELAREDKRELAAFRPEVLKSLRT
ncbi:hypothetical protein KIPB_015540, partial [Kipferlia bialata]|eukprot:g15540.t1